VPHRGAGRPRYDDDTDARSLTFLFRVGESLYVDAAREGNASRFINHSCEPNCEVEIEGTRISIRARKNIQPGVELTYDYALELEDDPLPDWERLYACRCGAPTCRGTMLDPGSPLRNTP
jgi:SET domain-containing protein